MNTKACSLTKDEVKALIMVYSREIMSDDTLEEALERMNYLNKRLRAFDEVEIVKEETKPEEPKKDGW